MKFAVRTLATGVLTAALAGVSTPVAAQGTALPTKIAYVDARAVLQGMPGYTAAESLYVKERDNAQIELEALRQAFDSLVADFEQQSVILSPSNRAGKQKDLEAQRQRVEQRAQQLSTMVASKERELLEPMQQRLTSIIDGIRAEGNYAVIYDLSAMGPYIISFDRSLDITARVVQRLQQSN